MIMKHKNYKHLFMGLVSILLVIAIGFSACAKPIPTSECFQMRASGLDSNSTS